jgi:predicted DNA-binding antitoxin AbrB/MazE fold protein
MSLEAEGIYENGVLKFDHALPLAEHQRVKITIHGKGSSIVRDTYGLIGWTGDPKDLRRIAEDPEFGAAESR